MEDCVGLKLATSCAFETWKLKTNSKMTIPLVNRLEKTEKNGNVFALMEYNC